MTTNLLNMMYSNFQKNRFKPTYLLIFFLLSIQFSCSNATFEREKEVFQYLSKVHNISFDKDRIVIILQTNFCGACSEDVISFLTEQIEQLQVETLIVLSENKKEITAKLDFKNTNTKILIDKAFQIEKYGLRYPSDLFFLLEKSSIKHWSYIEEEEFETIKKKLFQLK